MVALEELKPTWRDGAYTLFGVLLDRFGINYAIKKSKGYIDQSIDQATDRIAEKLVVKASNQQFEEKMYKLVEGLSSKVADLENELKTKKGDG